MKLIKKEEYNDIFANDTMFYYDFLNNKSNLLELVNNLIKNNYKIHEYKFSFNTDHVSEMQPIYCTTYDEMVDILAGIDLDTLNNLSFSSVYNDQEVFGEISPSTALVSLSIPQKKNNNVNMSL